MPYVNSHGQEIPKDDRNELINVVETEACGIMSDSGKVIKEEITVIETYGKNPLPPDRMPHCSKYIVQESLIVMSVGSYKIMDYKGNVDPSF